MLNVRKVSGMTGRMSFVWTVPAVPSWNHMFMLEAMTFKVSVWLDDLDPHSVIVQVWTNVYDHENPEGHWHAIHLPYLQPDDGDRDRHLYGKSVVLTSYGQYRFTFRMRDPDSGWKWISGYMVDGIISISPPTQDKWTHGPDYTHITDSIYLGNFIAATSAEKLGFDAVLNVADNLDLVPESGQKLLYKKVPMMDGACNHISDDKILEAVQWLSDHDQSCRRILVNCRAGIGRAGSVVVAYIFSKKREMSYDEAYNFVFQKRFVYPHRQLKESLYRLYPRK